jgi:hypothetical protein
VKDVLCACARLACALAKGPAGRGTQTA